MLSSNSAGKVWGKGVAISSSSLTSWTAGKDLSHVTCSEQTCDKKQLKAGGFVLAHNLREYYGPSWMEKTFQVGTLWRSWQEETAVILSLHI